MPPKKTLKSVIAKSAPAKPAPAKDAAKKSAAKASEIDDIFSTGIIASSSSKDKKAVPVKSLSKKSDPKSKQTTKKNTATTKSTDQTKVKSKAEESESSEDDTPLGESLDDSQDEDGAEEEEIVFDEEEQNESEEAAIAKLKARKINKPAGASQGQSKATVVTTKAKSGPKVEAVVFNERPAAAAAAAAAAKIQKFKRTRDDGPDSDDELEKKGKRRTDDGLRLFDIHDLNIGKGGDTDKCPFECECCY
ncbi:hypothetical protein KVV02_003323 [Mortierella alpina]|uniref:DUF1764-domain-containing protein n=1 Tax=Mortierella alpina TaxID=64518 RepID=A0A9P8CU62_MORAP|nr:hypothetical protein KVV02_003323 [Mortierella alpina]